RPNAGPCSNGTPALTAMPPIGSPACWPRESLDMARRWPPPCRHECDASWAGRQRGAVGVKALLVCQNLGVGGAEELILGMATHFHTVGVEAGVVALSRRGPVADEIAAAGRPMHFVAGQPG